MSRLDSSRMIVGYHGTDERVVTAVLSGKQDLQQSMRDYDWLGNGIYFWEQGPRRALEFAYEMADLGRNGIETPAIIGAYINLGDCLDFLDTADTHLLAKFHRAFRKQFAGLKNDTRRKDGTKLFHRLDCSVINSLVEFLKETKEREIDTVRGCFWEGASVYRGAQIREKSHIQIAVRNHGCILGYFRPRKLTV